MKSDAIIYVAGHTGLVGSAILKSLQKQGFSHIITKSSSELDLRNQQEVTNFFHDTKPEYVFLAAAKVGGIYANAHYPADFISDNLAIALNIINASFTYKVKKKEYICSLRSSIFHHFLLVIILSPSHISN